MSPPLPQPARRRTRRRPHLRIRLSHLQTRPLLVAVFPSLVAMGHAVAASADEEAPPPSATTSNPPLPARPRHRPGGAVAILVQRARSGQVRQALQPGAGSPLGGQAPHPDAQKESREEPDANRG